MLDVLNTFIVELRTAGIPVSLTEHVDAAAAMAEIDLGDRSTFKSALRATLVKSEDHRGVFDTAFEVYFADRAGLGDEANDESDGDESDEESEEESRNSGLKGSGKATGSGGGGGTMSAEELAQLLDRAIRNNDGELRSMVAREAVQRYGGMEPGRPVGGTYYLYRTLRNLDLEAVKERLLAEQRDQGGMKNALEERLADDELGARIDGMKKAIEAEIRRRLVEDRGAEALARSVRKPLPEDIDVMHATKDEMAQLQRALGPLSRKLAVRLTRKRRHGRKGPLDFRQTVRRSLSTGGVPIDPRYRHPRPAKPEIVVIADISGSVASFARFTLHLVYAISSQFSKVRAFVFVDGIDEVTRLFEHAEDPGAAVHRINTEADVIWVDGHSDYGHAFGAFHERWGDEINSRTSVLILGDARNNYHASEAWVVADLQAKARHVYWLNPEPSSYWGSGDSIVGEYAKYCDRVVEVRTLRQLEKFVGELA
ncbi:MAG: VWA domain-containing protein [Actinomycetes bacterium]